MPKVRGDYRTINASFWDDPDVQERLSPEARLLFAVLRTCKDYGVAGIYRYYASTVMAQTGFTHKRGWTDGQLKGVFDELEAEGIISHDPARSVVWVVNGLRWDPHVTTTHARQAQGILAQLRALPKTGLLGLFVAHYGIDPPPDLDDRILKSASAPHKTDGESLSLRFPGCDSVDTATGPIPIPIPKPTLNPNPSPAAGPDGAPASPPPPVTPGQQRNERDRDRAVEAESFAAQLVGKAEAIDTGGGTVAEVFIAEAERGIARYWESRGGCWTATRRRDWMARLDRFKIDPVMGAIEVFVDGPNFGNREEAFVVGIARRMARDHQQEPEHFHKEIAEHRRTHPKGVFAQALEVING